MPKPYPSSTDTDATVARVASAILELLADGMPRSKRAMVAALAERHDQQDLAGALMRLAVTGRLAEDGGRFTLPRPRSVGI